MSAVSSCSSRIRGEAMAAKASILIYLEPRETCLVAMIFVLFVQLESSPFEPRKPRSAVAFNFFLSIICKHIQFCCLGTRLEVIRENSVMFYGLLLLLLLAWPGSSRPTPVAYGILATVQCRAALYGCCFNHMVLIIYGHVVLTCSLNRRIMHLTS